MIEVEDRGAVRRIRLANPPANALHLESVNAIREGLSAAVADDVGAVVLTGAPGMFSAGLDLPHLVTLDREQIRATWDAFFGLLRDLATSPVPVAVAITGHSPAGGAVLALYCDYRVMARGRFKVGLNEIRVGLPLPAPIYGGLERLVGSRRAELLGVTGALVSPEDALAFGLVDELAEPDDVEARAFAWCEDLLKAPPTAVARTRALARAELHALFENPGFMDLLVDDWFTEETQAAINAVVEMLAAKRR